MGEVVRFPVAAKPPTVSPLTAAKREQAHSSQLAERMSMWLIHAEKEVGLRNARSMLISALGWLDMRAPHNSKNGKQL